MNKGEQTKQRIIQQARTLFSTTGYDATKTSEIAKACGISEAAMYKYFSSKMELLKACVVTAEPDEEITAHTDLSQSTNEELIDRYVNKRITMIERNHEQYSILLPSLRVTRSFPNTLTNPCTGKVPKSRRSSGGSRKGA